MTQCKLCTPFFGFESSLLCKPFILTTKFKMERCLLVWGVENCMGWRGSPNPNTV